MLVSSDNSEMSPDENKSPKTSTSPPIYLFTLVLLADASTSTSNSTCQAKEYVDDDVIAKLCTLCVGSKST